MSRWYDADNWLNLAIIAFLIAQLTMGIVFLDDDSKCSSNAAPFGLAIWNLASFCWKAFIMAYFTIRPLNYFSNRREFNLFFYMLVIHWVWIILGLVITTSTYLAPIRLAPHACTGSPWSLSSRYTSTCRSFFWVSR